MDGEIFNQQYKDIYNIILITLIVEVYNHKMPKL